MSNNDELIAQFIEISGSDEGVAKFYLSSSNWSLEDALSNFLGTQSENESPPHTATNTDATLMPSSEHLDSDASGSKSKVDDKFDKKSKPKFGTLRDMRECTQDDEEGQAFYAGGSERSGQQVLGPPKRKNFREQLTDMFRMAQEHGSQEENPAPSTSRPNWGQGMRLGMTDTDHTVVTPIDGGKKTDEKRPAVVLKLWSRGFSIDDGDLRLYEDPDNKEFLETVMRGVIPQELLQMGWMVNVDVEDRRHEDFRKPPQKVNFKGSGHTLGSPTPNVESAESTAQATVPPKSEKDEEEAKEKLSLNPEEPITTLQIRLSDGSRLAAQFNLTHTVNDIHQYIINARPQYATRNFILVSSFPTRELTESAVTIEEAGLKNAAILQRLI